MLGGRREPRFATRRKISCLPGSRLLDDPNTTSTYAMPAIDEPRTAVDPGIDLNDSVSTWVTPVATSVAGCPIQSPTSPTCGSERSGTASRDSDRRAHSPHAATTIATAITIQLLRVHQVTRREITALPRLGSPGPPSGAAPRAGKTRRPPPPGRPPPSPTR